MVNLDVVAIYVPARLKPSWFQLTSRSSTPSKHGPMLANGVGIFDRDYRGSAIAQLYNTRGQSVTLPSGIALVQLMATYEKETPCVQVLAKANRFFTETARGAGGLGSTGLGGETVKSR